MLTPRQNIGADSRGQSNFNLDTSLDTRSCDDGLFMAVIMRTFHRHDCLEVDSSTYSNFPKCLHRWLGWCLRSRSRDRPRDRRC